MELAEQISAESWEEDWRVMRLPSLMLWGRHDAFFDLEETLSWMQAQPRMEAHSAAGRAVRVGAGTVQR